MLKTNRMKSTLEKFRELAILNFSMLVKSRHKISGGTVCPHMVASISVAVIFDWDRIMTIR